MKRIIPLAVLALTAVMAGGAAAGTTFATVTGHEAFSEEANAASYWGENCVKDESVDGDSTFELPEGFFGTVIVKSGSGEFANTIFEGASGGETVWADTNGNFEPDDGDQEISHVITCEEQPTEPPATDEPTDEVTAPPTDEVTLPPDEPTEEPPAGVPPTAPPTDTLSTINPGSGAWLLIVALGVLLASLVVLTPRKR